MLKDNEDILNHSQVMLANLLGKLKHQKLKVLQVFHQRSRLIKNPLQKTLAHARLGEAHCPETGEKVAKQSPQQIIEQVLKFKDGSKLQLLSPVIRNKKGEHREELAKFQSMGFSRIRLNGEILTLDEKINVQKTKFNSIDIVVDRLVMKEGIRTRLSDSVEHALKLSDGYLIVLSDDKEFFF
jgi:excinuclease ABC subunit A